MTERIEAKLDRLTDEQKWQYLVVLEGLLALSRCETLPQGQLGQSHVDSPAELQVPQ